MPEHQLNPGKEVIAGLCALGTALGYYVEREHRLAPGTEAVDVAWLRRPHTAALIIFEVESKPSAGLAANALKVLGRARSGVMKPLHLFHVVVAGGKRSARPASVIEEFGGHNYSVHLLSDEEEPAQLLREVLDVHRRIEDRVNGLALAEALGSNPWSAGHVERLLQHAHKSGFSGISERTLVQLATQHPRFLRLLTERLSDLWARQLQGDAEPPNRYFEPPNPREEDYGSYMGAAAFEPLELGLLVAGGACDGKAALLTLRRWQELNHIGDQMGPFTGAGTEWTEYAVNNLGYLWALVAALFASVPGARRWCASQPSKLLESLNRRVPSVAPLAIWVMHIAAGEKECAPEYELARSCLEDLGGVSLTWLAQPHPAAPFEDDDEEWESLFPSDERFAPGPLELIRLVERNGTPAMDPLSLALAALLEDPAYRPELGGGLASFLARPADPTR